MKSNGHYTLDKLNEDPRSFVEHVKQYRIGEKDVPKLYIDVGGLYLTLSDSLLEKIANNDSTEEKINTQLYPYKVALNIGIVPDSISKTYGIEVLSEYNSNLNLKGIEFLIKLSQKQILDSLSVEESSLNKLSKILIKWHSSKKPLIGVFDNKNNMFILRYLTSKNILTK